MNHEFHELYELVPPYSLGFANSGIHPYPFDRLPSINSGQAGQVGAILRDTPMGIGAPQDVAPYIAGLDFDKLSRAKALPIH